MITKSVLNLLCTLVAFRTVGAFIKNEERTFIKNVYKFKVNATTNTEAARPFYNIGHMVNNQDELDEYLNYGANAIETDVFFAKNGTPTYHYHGWPCDIGRNCTRWNRIGPYIEAVRARTEPGRPKFNPSFTLIFFDLKPDEIEERSLRRAGHEFADVVLIPLFKNRSICSRLKAVIGVVKWSREMVMIKGILDRLSESYPRIISKIGFDVDSSVKLDRELFRRISHGHIWRSSGVTNWFLSMMQREIRKRLAKLVKERNSDEGKASKVRAWTVDSKRTMKNFLGTGLDVITSNRPGIVNKALAEFNKKSKEIKYRLATLHDDPFERWHIY